MPMELLDARLLPMQLSALIKQELLPVVLFFVMFFVVFGLGGGILRRVPRKPGSMLDEILHENWDEEEDADRQDGAVPEQEAAQPVPEQTDAADNGK